jgi:hypothetical protein
MPGEIQIEKRERAYILAEACLLGAEHGLMYILAGGSMALEASLDKILDFFDKRLR